MHPPQAECGGVMVIRNPEHVRLNGPSFQFHANDLAWVIGAGMGAVLGLPVMALYLLFFA
jgi:hypothetical protein